jgi:hypothetical protein
MFIVQGIIRVSGDPKTVRAGQEWYDGVLHETEGMYWNIYLSPEDDPSLTIHTQDWKEQATSEAFGVSPAFQAHRRTGTTGGQLTGMEGPLSPGYWRPVVERLYRDPPTGRDGDKLGKATWQIVFVRPGQEAAYEAVERKIAERLAGVDGVYWFRMFTNLGQPNAFSRIIHWESDPSEAIADLEAERRALVESERGGRSRIQIFSDWPDRRQKDGIPVVR